ncbi:TPA: hypothetical protein ACHJX8_004732 [Yersinia enterocolitica]
MADTLAALSWVKTVRTVEKITRIATYHEEGTVCGFRTTHLADPIQPILPWPPISKRAIYAAVDV